VHSQISLLFDERVWVDVVTNEFINCTEGQVAKQSTDDMQIMNTNINNNIIDNEFEETLSFLFGFSVIFSFNAMMKLHNWAFHIKLN
jgi:hypothetical protein